MKKLLSILLLLNFSVMAFAVRGTQGDFPGAQGDFPGAQRDFPGAQGDFPLFETIEKKVSSEKKVSAKAKIEQILHASPKPVYTDYQGDPKIMNAMMREYIVVKSGENIGAIGTYGLGPCMGVVFVSRKDGQIIKTAVSHVDAKAEMGIRLRKKIDDRPAPIPEEISNEFFDKALRGADDIQVTLVASDGYEDNAREIIQKILERKPAEAKVSFAIDLQGPGEIAVNTATGELYRGFDIFQDMTEPIQVLRKKSKQADVKNDRGTGYTKLRDARAGE